MERMEEMIAYCGLKCHECPAYIATKANDREKIEEVAREFSSAEQSFAPEDTWCDGCIEKNGRIFVWCKSCAIWNCASEKQVLNCLHCGDFPCQIIEDDRGGAKERLIALKGTL